MTNYLVVFEPGTTALSVSYTTHELPHIFVYLVDRLLFPFDVVATHGRKLPNPADSRGLML